MGGGGGRGRPAFAAAAREAPLHRLLRVVQGPRLPGTGALPLQTLGTSGIRVWERSPPESQGGGEGGLGTGLLQTSRYRGHPHANWGVLKGRTSNLSPRSLASGLKVTVWEPKWAWVGGLEVRLGLPMIVQNPPKQDPKRGCPGGLGGIFQEDAPSLSLTSSSISFCPPLLSRLPGSLPSQQSKLISAFGPLPLLLPLPGPLFSQVTGRLTPGVPAASSFNVTFVPSPVHSRETASLVPTAVVTRHCTLPLCSFPVLRLSL